MNTLREAVREYLEMRRALGIQASRRRQGPGRFREVHGATQGAIHYTGVSAGLGSTAIQCSTSVLGATAELHPRIRKLP